MTDLVPASEIESRVGARRHATEHLARAASAEQTVYILHSQECLDSGNDLRACAYSTALDRGIDAAEWVEDAPVVARLVGGRLLGWLPTTQLTPRDTPGDQPPLPR